MLDLERIWAIKASLTIILASIVLLFCAPAIGYPLDFDQSIRLLQIIIPVFSGYLGLAAASIFGNAIDEVKLPRRRLKLLRILLRGPIYVSATGLAFIAIVFGMTNRQGALPGTGMTIDQLAWSITALLGILASTTGLIVSKLFPQAERSGP
jgi:hypothetical protein